MTKEPPPSKGELARLRAKTGDQEAEIARLRDELSDAAEEHARLEDEGRAHLRRDRDLSSLVRQMRTDAKLQDHDLADMRATLAAVEVELHDLRAVRDALTPPELPSRPGIELAAALLPASEQVSGDFYLAAEGPHNATVLVVGDVVGKGHIAARRAAFVRTVFATTAPFSDDPARLLSWANVALGERENDHYFVTAACLTVSANGGSLRWAYAGHPAVLRLDSGEELSGGRTLPLGVSQEFACRPVSDELTPGMGVLLYTDGLIEARRDGEQFGTERLSETLRALEGQPTSRIVAAVTQEVDRFTHSKLSDDLCVVAARVV